MKGKKKYVYFITLYHWLLFNSASDSTELLW